MGANWSHEESYRGISPASWIHRARLRGILSALQSIEWSNTGALADFGCSNGFVLAQLRLHVFREPAAWALYGFDHAQGFLDQAKEKRIPNTRFHEFNLNEIGSEWQDAFDIVLCLETLEHTGNFRNAFYNLWMSCKPGGYLVTTVPIEVGIPGIVKFFGRKLIYRQPYRRFFAERSQRAYVRALLTGVLDPPCSVARDPLSAPKHREIGPWHAGRLRMLERVRSRASASPRLSRGRCVGLAWIRSCPGIARSG